MATMVYGLVYMLIVIPWTTDACTYPADFIGTWKHSYYGSIYFESTTRMQMTETSYGTVTLNCNTELISGTKYIVISDDFTDNGGNAVKMKICMEFTKLKDYLYKVVQRTTENSKSSYERAKVAANSSTDYTEATVCDDSTSEPDSEYFLLMKDGEIANVKTDFPTDFQGTLSYTFDGTLCSGDSGSADICTDTTLLDFDYTQCSDVVGYTASGHLNCLYYTSSSGTYTIWTYNQDSSVDKSATYYFTCFKVTVTGTTVITVSATQNPYFCDSTQTDTAVSTGSTTLGKTITGTVLTSPPTVGSSTAFCVLLSYICYLLHRHV